MARLKSLTVSIVLLTAAVWAAEPKARNEENPDVELRASPRVSIAPPGGARIILLTAEIVGRETEKYYCPEVVWEWPDRTRSSVESDCAPFEERTDYPRRFIRRIGAPSMQQDYRVCVVLRKDGEPFDKSCARYTVH